MASDWSLRTMSFSLKTEADWGFWIAAEAEAVFCHEGAELVEAVGRQAVGAAAGEPEGLAILQMEDMAEVDQGVAAHGEGELSLAGGDAGDDGDEQGAGIEYGGEGGEPALVVMLRTVVTEDGVGDVGLEDLRGPALPLG